MVCVWRRCEAFLYTHTPVLLQNCGFTVQSREKSPFEPPSIPGQPVCGHDLELPMSVEERARQSEFDEHHPPAEDVEGKGKGGSS